MAFVVHVIDSAVGGLWTDAGGFGWLALPLSSLVAIGVAVASMLYAVRLDFSAAFIRMAGVFALGIGLVAVPVDVVSFVSQLLVSSATNLFEIAVIYFMLRRAHETGASATTCYSLGELVISLGILVGSVIGVVAGAEATLGVVTEEGVALACVVAFCLALSLWSVPRPATTATSVDGADGCGKAQGTDSGLGMEGLRMEGANTKGAPFTLAIACNVLAEEHGLTDRERDVLPMLAQGRTQPYIRDALGLSRNTISFHVRNIYAKLGVHSKQELIDIVGERMLGEYKPDEVGRS